MATFTYDQADWLAELREEGDTKSLILNEMESLIKERRYIDDPSEAPEDADVQEGPQGGLYYEVSEDDPVEVTEEEMDNLSDEQVDFIRDNPEVYDLVTELNSKFGPKLTNSFLQHAAEVLDYVGLDTIDQVATLFLSEDGPPTVDMPATEKGQEMAREVEGLIWKQAEEALEIKDYYRVWVKSPDDVPEEQTVRYDSGGDGMGNRYYYEVPFTTSTRINLSAEDDAQAQITKAMHEKPRKEYPDREDLVAANVPEKDLTLVDKVRDHAEKGEPLFGTDLRKSHPSILHDVESALTLLSLYKTLHDQGATYESFMNQIQKEFKRRGVYTFERVSKAQRYIDHPDEAPEGVEVQEGPEGGLYYETEDVAGDGSSGGGRSVSSMVDNLPIDHWPEGHAHLSADQLREETRTLFDRTDDAVAVHVLDHLEHFRNKSKRSGYSFKEDRISFRPDADTETISHEVGHAILGSYGYTIADVGNSFAHFYVGEVPDFEFGATVEEVLNEMAEEYLDRDMSEEVREETETRFEEMIETHGDKTIEREDMYVKFAGEDFEDVPDGVRKLARQVNAAWERMADAKVSEDADASEYIINQPYSAVNAHETMAMTHETMQGDVADPVAVENLYRRHPELLDAYVNLFEPGRIQRDMLNELFKTFGANGVWDDLPYPEAEGVLEG